MNKLVIVSVAALALGAGLFLGVRQSPPDLAEISGFSFPEPDTLTNISLIDHNSQPVTEANFANQWTFVYVGYTFCPDACPMSLTTLSQMDSVLKKQGGTQAEVMLVSVDPERDTPEHLNGYVTHFNEGFTAATGSPDAIREFADQMRAVYALPDDRTDPNYLVDHSSSIILINPDAAVQAVFTPPQNADALAKDFKLLVAHYESR